MRDTPGESGESAEGGSPAEGDTSPDAEIWTLDRFEGDLGVLISDDGRVLEVARADLPDAIRPGSVVLIHGGVDAEALPPGAIEMSEALTERRRAEAREILDELKRRDPGGDISIG
ncbi:MAG: DUF3006 domain-containing protein [Longimicrobiales bacterium]|nr:DUF3006 domain-containing protein [Longimicrobiales bacterium]